MGLHLKWLTAFCLSLSITTQVFAFKSDEVKDVKFEMKKIALNRKTILVEMAETERQHEHGLMLRKSLAKDHGMLFVFKNEEILNFWMKNTLINLSIGYFDKNKTLIDIQEMKAMTSVMQQNFPTYPSRAPAMYALEMTEGWFEKNKVLTGAVFSFVN